MSKVIAFKISNGQEVVAELVSTVEVGDVVKSYVIRRPHILQMQQTGPNQVGLALIPWTLSNPDIREVTIPATSLLLPPFEPSASTEKQYLEQTSGISLSRDY